MGKQKETGTRTAEETAGPPPGAKFNFSEKALEVMHMLAAREPKQAAEQFIAISEAMHRGDEFVAVPFLKRAGRKPVATRLRVDIDMLPEDAETIEQLHEALVARGQVPSGYQLQTRTAAVRWLIAQATAARKMRDEKREALPA